MSNPKQVHEVPQEVMEAVKEGDFVALGAFRSSLSGDEVIAACDTVPVFDWMIEHVEEATPQETQELKECRAMLAESKKTRKLVDVVEELERVTVHRFERDLMKRSPAMYALRKMMQGGDCPGPDTLRVGDGQGRYQSLFNIR